MKLTRKYTLFIVLALVSALFSQLVVLTGLIGNNEQNKSVFYDFEENSESNEDHKSDNELNNYTFGNFNEATSTQIYESNCLRFGKFDLKHSMDVFPDVITPPPEA